MTVYVVIATNIHNKRTSNIEVYKDEEAAYEEQEILQHELGEDFYVEVEERELRGEEGFNA